MFRKSNSSRGRKPAVLGAKLRRIRTAGFRCAARISTCVKMKHHNPLGSTIKTACRTGILVVLAVVGGLPGARACDTPVYRYAMLNWAPSHYRVFYLHRGRLADEAEQVRRVFAELAESAPTANVRFDEVDVSDERQWDALDPAVKKVWQAHDGDPASMNPASMYLVFRPLGAELYAGQLDPAAVRAMIDSPARTRLGEALEAGNAAVLLLLAGTSAAENERAEKVARRVIAEAEAGAIAVEPRPALADFFPGETASPAPAEDAGEPAEAEIQLALVKISRTDSAEAWLVRMLRSVEPDLDRYAEQPMIFVVYGRGRTMLPCIGRGITWDNLAQCVAFLAGACSCQVKAGNPGADLLIRWDWRSTADALAAAAGEPVGGGPLSYHEFTPGGPAEVDSPTEIVQPPRADPAAVAALPEPATLEYDDEAPAAEDSFATRQAWLFGIALAIGAVVVLSAGFVLLRRQ